MSQLFDFSSDTLHHKFVCSSLVLHMLLFPSLFITLYSKFNSSPRLKILVFYFLNDKKLTESRSCSGSFTFVIIFFCPYPSHLEIYLHFKSSDISLFPSSFKKSISVLFNWGFVTESPGSVRSVKVTNFFSPISYLPSIPWSPFSPFVLPSFNFWSEIPYVSKPFYLSIWYNNSKQYNILKKFNLFSLIFLFYQWLRKE